MLVARQRINTEAVSAANTAYDHIVERTYREPGDDRVSTRDARRHREMLRDALTTASADTSAACSDAIKDVLSAIRERINAAVYAANAIGEPLTALAGCDVNVVDVTYDTDLSDFQ